MPDLADSDYDLVPVDQQPQFADQLAPPSALASQVQGFPQRAADLGMAALGPIGEAGMTVGDMMRTGQVDPRDIPQVVGGVMMGAAAPEAEEAAPLEAGAEAVAKGITAYHGSPYDFDKFDLSKIGTGEGAQAYGHGLYLAENPSVAESYRTAGPAGNVPPPTYEAPSDVLTRNAEDFGKFAVSSPLLVKGLGSLDVEGRSNVLPVMRGLLQDPEVGKAVVRLLPVDVMHMLGGKQLTPETLLHNPSMLVDLLPANANDLVSNRVKAADVLAPYVARATAERPLIGSQSTSLLNEALAARSANQGDLHVRSEIPYPTRVGKTYQVSINADPEHFLDWDKPLSEQSPHVQNALTQLGYFGEGRTPSVGYQKMAGDYGGPDMAATMLHQAGIPGIKYLDQGSRGSGDGTHNYVVFSPDIINIVKKYGMAGLIAGGGAHFATVPTNNKPDFGDQHFAKGGSVKSTKAQAHYHGGTKAKRCADCNMFEPPHGCSAVRGSISPHGVCDFFERKSASKAA